MKRILNGLVFLAGVHVSGCQMSKAAHLDAPSSSSSSHPLQEKWRDHIKVETVTEDEAPVYITTTGRVGVDEDRTQHIAAPVNGRVQAVLVRLGDKVRPGQAVVELASTDVAQLQADVKKAQQDLDVASKSLARAKRLHGDGAVADREVLQAQADFAKARTDVDQGQAHLKALGLNPSGPAVRAALYARVAGTVVQRNVMLGQEVRADATEPLMTITDLDTLWVTADVFERDLSHAAVGAMVQVEVPAYPGKSFPGTVTYVGDVIDAASRTVKVRCVVPNPHHKLKPEMFAKVHIDQQRTERALYVPVQALLHDGPQTQVLMVRDDKVVETKAVRTGNLVDGRQQITDGLRSGDVIVTDGALFLQHAMRL